MDITYYKQYEPIFGEWKIVREIGEGSFGKVFEIERVDDYNGDTYKAALKAITIPQNKSEVDSIMDNGLDQESVTAYFRGVVDEFIEEFKLMSKLEGESNVVSYKGHRVIEHENGIGWDILIQMELLTPLLKYTKEHNLSQEEVINLGIDMCKALELCRKHNIIHRDIKPENIFLSNNGKFKLGDFGIAKTVEKTTGGLSKKGTYTYMAPEVYKGEEYGPSVDIYSLGIVLYRYLNNNRAPFLPAPPAQIKHTDANAALERRIISGESIPAPLNADERLSKIILKACAYEAKDRYASPTEMREDLEAVAAGFAPQHVAGAAFGAFVRDEEKTVTGLADSKQVPVADAPHDAAAKDADDEKEAPTVGAYGAVSANVLRNKGVSQEDANSPSLQKEQEPVEAKLRTITPAKKSPANRKKKNPLIIAACCVLLLACGAGIFALGEKNVTVQEDWTEWLAELPKDVTEEDFIIEEETRYRNREKETATSTESDEMDGWELEKTADTGDFGAWSEWSATPVTASDSREVETETRYRSRSLETTTSSNSSLSGWELTNTTYSWGNYGAWSSWSTTSASSSDARKVETKTQYSSRSISYTTRYTDWGSWSSWQDSSVSSNDLRTVETRTVYHYYYYLCPYCGAHMHGYGTCYTWAGGCGKSTTSDCYHAEWLTIPYSSASEFQGTGVYYVTSGGSRYFAYISSGSAHYVAPKTQYRYATRSTYQEASYGSWSSYSDTHQSASSTKEVRTRTMYRYCDRQKIPTYHYQRWGSWGSWTTQSMSSSSTKQVETATFYRCREKTDETTYIFSRWTDWSDWATDPIEETDENEVETIVFYRYKSK